MEGGMRKIMLFLAVTSTIGTRAWASSNVPDSGQRDLVTLMGSLLSKMKNTAKTIALRKSAPSISKTDQWQIYHTPAFSMRLPADMHQTNVAGIDSYFVQFIGLNISLEVTAEFIDR